MALPSVVASLVLAVPTLLLPAFALAVPLLPVLLLLRLVPGLLQVPRLLRSVPFLTLVVLNLPIVAPPCVLMVLPGCPVAR